MMSVKLSRISLDLRYGTIQIKQFHTVTYLGCALDENLSGKTMALKVMTDSNNVLAQ